MDFFLKNTSLFALSSVLISIILDFGTGYWKAKKKGNLTSRQWSEGMQKKMGDFGFIATLLVASYWLGLNESTSQIALISFSAFNFFAVQHVLKEIKSITENLKSIGILSEEDASLLLFLVGKFTSVLDKMRDSLMKK